MSLIESYANPPLLIAARDTDGWKRYERERIRNGCAFNRIWLMQGDEHENEPDKKVLPSPFM